MNIIINSFGEVLEQGYFSHYSSFGQMNVEFDFQQKKITENMNVQVEYSIPAGEKIDINVRVDRFAYVQKNGQNEIKIVSTTRNIVVSAPSDSPLVGSASYEFVSDGNFDDGSVLVAWGGIKNISKV